MKRSCLVIVLLLITVKSYSQVDLQKEIEALKQVDIEFSALSASHGMKEAFLTYIADDGILLRPYSLPITGYEAVKKFLDENGGGDFTLTWTPIYADVSIAGDMGYTYGVYDLSLKDSDGKDQLHRGTYVSIWKKDKFGKWKFTLDTGNPGLEPKKE
jgi:ketosteroid isomerase-like protein